MSYTVSGRLVDKDKQPIEFGIVYTSDSSGKPIAGSKNYTADDKGRWILNGVKDTDYITGTMVGFNKKTISAKSIVPIPNPITGISQRMIQITLPDDAQATLSEIPVISKKVTTNPKNIGKYIAIGGAGLLLITGIMFFVSKSKKVI
ncbi:MAG: hypothetical protein IPJ01_11875 [Micavibrio sp.]|nr:hypothetical protein [Micavibrio sp.]